MRIVTGTAPFFNRSNGPDPSVSPHATELVGAESLLWRSRGRTHVHDGLKAHTSPCRKTDGQQPQKVGGIGDLGSKEGRLPITDGQQPQEGGRNRRFRNEGRKISSFRTGYCQEPRTDREAGKWKSVPTNSASR